MVLGSSVKVLLSAVDRWLHTLQHLPQVPEVAVVVFRRGGATEDPVAEQVKRVREGEEDDFVYALEDKDDFF